ncbi:MAG: hypothetical protein CO139_01665, partial [Candidatus Moranbacteria bacterium CG_4_9_14_3_um_filter_36_9]
MKKIEIKIIFSILAFSFGLFLALSSPVLAADDAADIQGDIKSSEKKVDKTEAQLNQTQNLLKQNQAQVNTTQYLINKTETEISRKEAELENLDKRTALNKKILGEYLLEIYLNDQQDPLVRLVADKKNLSDLVENFDQMVGVKEKILAILKEIKENKNKINEVKEDLAEKKDDHEKLLVQKQSEQVEIKKDIKKAEATLGELNAKINKLKSQLSSLLGSVASFKNITDAASFASKATGVRKDFLLGVLVVESDLGRYTGGCTYNKTNMSKYREDIFKDIMRELKYELKSKKLSCPPRSYKGTGGAMGVAQFMPDTWIGYKKSVAAVTGNNPPDPWSLTDGVTAMALKLAKVIGVTAHKKSAEAKAYCVYLAGNNWAAYCDNKGTNYGDL